ncbi:MAG: cytochrome c4 [Gammaproteobacteria bacterium]|nr:cytochrome c4 [Gammaproteobacteria bacterium]
MENFKWLNTSILITVLGTITPLSAIAEDIESVKAKCGMCHGPDGNSPNSSIPSIAGMTKEFFAHTMDAYQNNGRPSDLMKPYVHYLSQEDISQLAEFYAKQTFKPVKQEYDPARAKKGEALHNKYCEKCHENAGKITENNFGFLAGQWMPYLRQSIQDYLDKKRRVNPMMITKLEKLQQEAGKDGLDDVLHYYASLQ